MIMRGLRRSFCVLFVAGLLAVGEAQAQERNAAAEAGLGVLSFALTIPYGLVKTGYAIAGTITGGLAWVFTGGNTELAQTVIQRSLRGDYVIVPEHLLNERPLVFAGRDP